MQFLFGVKSLGCFLVSPGCRRESGETRRPSGNRSSRILRAESLPMKTERKTITVAGQQIVIYSLDGKLWSSDLRQLRERMRLREEEMARVLDSAKKFFKSCRSLAEKSRS